jgi:probable HAF family extracellular repeat protein
MRALPLTIAAFAALLPATALSVPEPTYTVTDLGQAMPGWQVMPLALNQAGISVGDAFLDSYEQRAVTFGQGRVIVLPQTSAIASATGINRDGKIVGTMSSPLHPNQVGFASVRGSTKGLGTLGGATSTARGVNDAGQIVGGAATARGPVHAYLYDDGQMTDLGTLGGQGSEALALNAGGTVVGRAQLPSGDTHAFSWHSGKMTDLGTLGGNYGGGSSIANAVNADGLVAGQSSVKADSGVVHAFRWGGRDGFDDLGVLSGGQNSFALGINSDGVVVGGSETTGRVFHAFIVRTNGSGKPMKMIDLNTELDSRTGSGWVLTSATAINDAGQIIGYGSHRGVQAAFLLTPQH